MNRRSFLTTAAASLAGAFPAGSTPQNAAASGIYSRVLAAAEAEVEKLLPRQQPDGGLLDGNEIPQAHATAGFVQMLASVYLAPESRHHRSAGLLPRMLRAARQLRRMQNADGTIDLPTTNFGSPPDTGFVLEVVCVTATVLRQRGYPETRELREELESFARAAAESLVTGGVHTPNHRWVVVAALARCHSLFPDTRYVARIDQWLAEGIDQDAEGNYTERSTGIYNWVTNETLLTAGRLLQRPELYEAPRKNLEAMLYFVRPNAEVATDISRRQDRFARWTMRPHYRPYRLLSLNDRNARFAEMAARIEAAHASEMAGELIYFLEMPEMAADPAPRAASLPEDFDRFYPLYGFAHIRRGGYDATVMGNHSRFFSFRNGGAVLEAVRLASAFFGKGQFTAPLAKTSGGYRLEQQLEADYLQPLEPGGIRAGEEWAATRPRRARSNIFKLASAVEVRERGKGFEIAIEVAGTDRVPVAVELTFRPGGRLTGTALSPVANTTGASFLGEGYALYEQEGKRLRIGPGVRRHGWTQLRGAEPRIEGLSVYLTAFTPFRHTVGIMNYE